MSSLIPLRCLIAGKSNPRKTKPDQEAHQRLLASVVVHELIHPLVVRPVKGKHGKTYIVIAGNRRLAVLKELHRGKGDVKVPCIVRKVDAVMADALSLGENFAREPMHPLDEAEAFAKLARHDGKDAESIAAEFGVSDKYVRQRMKLADLAKPIGDAYRSNAIDTATAETFASVPKPQQQAIWNEVEGRPHSAHQVKSIIAHAWISSRTAMFDVSSLPPEAVSADLFGEDVLVEREAFLKAQQDAVELRRQALVEDGWANVIIGDREQVRDRLWSMDEPQPVFDSSIQKELTMLARKQKQFEKQAGKLKLGDRKREALMRKMDAIEAKADKVIAEAPAHFTEQTKAKATVFLIVDPSGSVQEEYRHPRPKHADNGSANGAVVDKPLDSDDLTDGQLASILAHQAMAVRLALLGNSHLRNVVLAMALHNNVRSDALSVKHVTNDSTVHADNNDEFKSTALYQTAKKRFELDPLITNSSTTDIEAFDTFVGLSDETLKLLIQVLTVECLTHQRLRSNELVVRLADDLKVKIHEHWTPDAAWLKGYRKVQLLDLLTKFSGKDAAPAPSAKHSELVNQLAEMFAAAANDTMKDKKLAEKLNRWTPNSFMAPPKSQPVP